MFSHKAAFQTLSKAFFEAYEDMVEISLVLEIYLTKDTYVEDLLCGASSCSEACQFFNFTACCLQHDFVMWLMRLIVR